MCIYSIVSEMDDTALKKFEITEEELAKMKVFDNG